MATLPAEITVGPLEEGDIAVADAVFRLAFGTALQLPEPQRFAEGADLVRTRWLADPASAFKAESGGELVGCALVARWGSYAVFGPLAVHPECWGRGVGRLLWEECLPLIEGWGVSHTALFTRAEAKNVHLYQSFGFWPGSVTALTAKRIEPARRAAPWRTFADVPTDARGGVLDDCRRVTDAVYPGLDLEREIRVLDRQGLGETIFVDDAAGLCGLAVCHAGVGSEAGPDACYVKFAAVAPGAGAAGHFGRLLDACERYAAAAGVSRLVAGANAGRHEAYCALLDRGHRPFVIGVAMHRPGEPAYDRPGLYVVDDGR